MRHLIEEFVKRPEATQRGPAEATTPADLAWLTEREVEMLGLVARGFSNTEIGQRLRDAGHGQEA